ncbi:hypothetical protein H072_2444 [Dactylellina haptotyla CBS 200.50]|uniref:Uncharacterized protein n=1 Tax=Dactylellina haptotyla (strain CBS 200.50) TaxID=1284197 RepID=S8AL74_DACHA|nr:hypothetical protein H072_2444 [Dactylellina haptotyla CBS 200.50]
MEDKGIIMEDLNLPAQCHLQVASDQTEMTALAAQSQQVGRQKQRCGPSGSKLANRITIPLDEHNQILHNFKNEAYGEMAMLREEIDIIRKQRNAADASLAQFISAQASSHPISTLDTDNNVTDQLQQAVEDKKYEIEALKQSNKALQTAMNRFKQKVKILEDREHDLNAQLEITAELRHLQAKEYEATKKGPILLDEDAQKSIEEIFGQKIRTWARLAFRGMSKYTLISTLLSIRPNNFIPEEIFAIQMTSTVALIGPVAFFETLIASAVSKFFFGDPYFLSKRDLHKSLTLIQQTGGVVNIELSCNWKSKTVELLETIARKYTNPTENSENPIEVVKVEEFIENLNGYAGLIEFLRECANLAIDWHKRPMDFMIVGQEYVGKAWNHTQQGEFCTIFKGTGDDSDGKYTDQKIIAIINPGFVKLTDSYGRKLPKPIVWSKALVALAEQRDIDVLETKNAPQDDIEMIYDSVPTYEVQVPGTPETKPEIPARPQKSYNSSPEYSGFSNAASDQFAASPVERVDLTTSPTTQSSTYKTKIHPTNWFGVKNRH